MIFMHHSRSPRLYHLMGIFIPAAAGLLWFVLAGGGPALHPTNIDWMMKDDWHQHLLGWLFYRQEPWHFPPGLLKGFMYPVGTTLGFMDSLPWLAVFFKPFSNLLPINFQYFGPWLGVCFAAQGLFGALLVRLISPRLIHQILGGILFALAPPLLKRINHPALCAHWLILALLWLNLSPISHRAAAWRKIGLAYVLNLFCAGIHPYLAVMTCLLTLAFFLRLRIADRVLTWKEVIILGLGMPLLILGTFYLMGFLSSNVGLGSHGFGSFSADTLALFNSMGWSRFIPKIDNEFHQYEGFAYLGLGVLVGTVLVVMSLILNRDKISKIPWRRVAPMGVAILLLTVFSFSSVITVLGKPILKLESLYAPFHAYVEPFRSSGRFIWPFHYLWVASVALFLPWLWPQRPLFITTALIVLVGIQAADITPKPLQTRWEKSPFRPLSSPGWNLATQKYQHLVLYPAEVDLTSCQGPDGYRPDAVMTLAYQAYRMKMTFNSGYVARRVVPNDVYCAPLQKQVQSGDLDPQTVYLTWPKFKELFIKAGATCGVLDGTQVCVRPKLRDEFADLLAKHPS